jgi:hypothetical protein
MSWLSRKCVSLDVSHSCRHPRPVTELAFFFLLQRVYTSSYVPQSHWVTRNENRIQNKGSVVSVTISNNQNCIFRLWMAKLGPIHVAAVKYNKTNNYRNYCEGRWIQQSWLYAQQDAESKNKSKKLWYLRDMKTPCLSVKKYSYGYWSIKQRHDNKHSKCHQ